MQKIGFDNLEYIKRQSQEIRDRIDSFGDKLYLEFGGKLFDDFHASRVLPGFEPDAKIKLLQHLKEKTEVVFCISAGSIETTKIRADLGIDCSEKLMIGQQIVKRGLNLVEIFLDFHVIKLDFAVCQLRRGVV